MIATVPFGTAKNGLAVLGEDTRNGVKLKLKGEEEEEEREVGGEMTGEGGG